MLQDLFQLVSLWLTVSLGVNYFRVRDDDSACLSLYTCLRSLAFVPWDQVAGWKPRYQRCPVEMQCKVGYAQFFGSRVCKVILHFLVAMFKKRNR